LHNDEIKPLSFGADRPLAINAVGRFISQPLEVIKIFTTAVETFPGVHVYIARIINQSRVTMMWLLQNLLHTMR
jgi:hypothetical protein